MSSGRIVLAVTEAQARALRTIHDDGALALPDTAGTQRTLATLAGGGWLIVGQGRAAALSDAGRALVSALALRGER